MTLSIRMPARLLPAEDDTPLATGIALLWADPDGWGGIFELAEPVEALREAVASAPLAARLALADGRLLTVSLGRSAFIADGVAPLTIQGYGAFDQAGFRHFTDVTGKRRP